MKEKNNTRRLLTTSVLLALLAFVSVTAATAAWMTIADRTRVRSMRMEITSGANLRFDLDAHDSFEDYVKTLSFAEIAARIAQDQGYDHKTHPLTPVTTRNFETFVLENGTAAKKEYYLEFTLHFMATEDMIVHLTSASSSGGSDGTRIESQRQGVPDAMRISFTETDVSVYDPGLGDTSTPIDGGKQFGLPSGGTVTYNDGNALFSLKANEDKPVVVRVWLEGTDPACNDSIRNADFKIWLRFIGTDENGNPLIDQRNEKHRTGN